MNKKFLIYLIVFTVTFISGFIVGGLYKKSEYNSRCMRYFGNQGYPSNFYCKLFIQEIKARDEQ